MLPLCDRFSSIMDLRRCDCVRESIAEILGTFFLVFLGNNAVAQKVLTSGGAGNFGTVYLGYALGAFVGILVSIGTSDAHLNPAVTLAGACMGKLSWWKVPHYMAGQYIGAFLAACGTYLLYLDGFSSYHIENGVNITTAGIFATYPREGLSIAGGFIDQILGTMVLVVAIYAIVDKKNSSVPAELIPLYVSLVIVSIGCSIAWNEGYAINPARDFSPRLFTYLTLWGSQVFSNKSFWYVTIIGPHIGGILGAWIYVALVENLRPDEEQSNITFTSFEKNEKKPSLQFTGDERFSYQL